MKLPSLKSPWTICVIGVMLYFLFRKRETVAGGLENTTAQQAGATDKLGQQFVSTITRNREMPLVQKVAQKR